VIALADTVCRLLILALLLALPGFLAPAWAIGPTGAHVVPVVDPGGDGGVRRAPDEVLVGVVCTSTRSAWAKLYAYCGGDPVNRSDPSGLDWVWNNPPGEWKWDGQFDGEPMTEDEAVAEGITKPEAGPHDTAYWGGIGLPPGDDGQFRVGADIDYIMARSHFAMLTRDAFENERGLADLRGSLLVQNNAADLAAYRDRLDAAVYDSAAGQANRRLYGSPFHEVFSDGPSMAPPLPYDPASEAGLATGPVEAIMGTLLEFGTTPQAAFRGLAAAGAFTRAGGAWAGREAVGAGGRFAGGFAQGWRAGPRILPQGAVFTGPGSLALINAAVKASKGLATGATSAISKRLSHSRILGQNLAAESLLARPAGTAAHHIVAWDDPRAAVARSVLQRFGIGIDDAANGAFLPRNLRIPGTGTAHSIIHTDAYYKRVAQLLDPSVVTSREDALDALLYIRNRLLNEVAP